MTESERSSEGWDLARVRMLRFDGFEPSLKKVARDPGGGKAPTNHRSKWKSSCRSSWAEVHVMGPGEASEGWVSVWGTVEKMRYGFQEEGGHNSFTIRNGGTKLQGLGP